MNRFTSLIFCFAFLLGCTTTSNIAETVSTVSSLSKQIPVTTNTELAAAIKNAEPGDVIVMSNGTWEDAEIKFKAKGTETNPITLKAETAGEVFIEGLSRLQLSGEHLIVEGLYFRNGYSPKSAVIEFRTSTDDVAFHSTVKDIVIEDFNKPQRNQTDLWVKFYGRHNELSNSYFAGKANRGPTVRVELEGLQNAFNYHQIVKNHFGPRPPKGGPSAETIQIGNSYTSVSPSHTNVENNLFDRCNGEVEVISSKANHNTFKNNVFYLSEGSLVTRHGNYCTIDGNYFIGEDGNDKIGGVRLIGTGHWVTNNYFYNLEGEQFRSPLALMNGIKKSPQNRYIQVTDVVVADNTYVDCESPWHIGVGSNIDQADVLPASEIRSEIPIRTTVANNVIYNSTADDEPIQAHDKLDGVRFESNVINNQGGSFDQVDGLKAMRFDVANLGNDIYTPTNLTGVERYEGFGFETIQTDLFGASRESNDKIGAIVSNGTTKAPNILDYQKFGPSWFQPVKAMEATQTHKVSSTADLHNKLKVAKSGDMIELAAGTYTISSTLPIDKEITIQGDGSGAVTIAFNGQGDTPLFTMMPKGDLELSNLAITGSGSQIAFATLKENMSSHYDLHVENVMIDNFDTVLHGYKYSMAENISFINSMIKNSKNGIVLAAEDDAKGDYNAENLTITNCQFDNIAANAVNYYRGGYDESTVGGTLVVENSKFTNSGASAVKSTLLKTTGIIYVDIENNVFENNPVELVALLWGAQKNFHANNTVTNSGQIKVEQNLVQELLY